MGKTAKKAATKGSAAKSAPASAAVKSKTSAHKPAAAQKESKPRKQAAPKKSAANHYDPQRFTLYGVLGSGPTYSVGLMLSLCKHPFSYFHVNLRESQHKEPDYLVKNRYGQVPSLRDRQTYYVQSAAILEHLSDSLKKFDGKTEFEHHRVREWLFWQWDKLAVPVYRLRARARGYRQFGEEVRVMYDTEAKAAIAVLEHELSKSEWIATKRPTIADISIYAVLRYAPEASIDLTPYPQVLAWKKRFEALPGFGTPEDILPLESRLL